MVEIIKKIALFLGRTLAHIGELIVLLALIVIFFIRTIWFQNVVAEIGTEFLSGQIGMSIEIDRVKFNGIQYAEVNSLLVLDHHDDTLIYSPHINASLEKLSLDSRFAILEALNTEGTRVKIQKYKGEEVFNFQPIIDYFKSEEVSESKFTLKLQEVNLKDAHITYFNHNIPVKEFGMDYEHVDLTHVAGKIAGLRNRGEVTTMVLDHISFVDRSGFILEDLNCDLLVNNHKVRMDNLNIKTPYSDIQTLGIAMRYDSYDAFQNFLEEVEINAFFEPTRINVHDLSYFVTPLRDIDHAIQLNGNITGTVSDLHLDEIFLGVNDGTSFKGDAYVKGLPSVDSTVLNLSIDRFTTSKKSIDEIDLLCWGLDVDEKLPPGLGALGDIEIIGEVKTGFKTGVVDTLMVNTDAGNISLNLDFELDTNSVPYFESEVKTTRLFTAEVLGDETLEYLAADLHVKGKGVDAESFELSEISGRIDSLRLDGNTYDALIVNDVSLTPKMIDGNISLMDNLAEFNFDGVVDMERAPYEINFKADLLKGHLAELGYVTDRDCAKMTASLIVAGSGTNFDDFNGLVRLSDLSYSQEGEDYDFESIIFSSGFSENSLNDEKIRTHEVDVMSEFADIHVIGAFTLDSLEQSFYNLGAEIFPSIFPREKEVDLAREEFDMEIQIHDLSKLTRLFYPRLKVSEGTKIHMDYVAQDEMLELAVESDWVQFDSMRFAGITLDTTRKFHVFDTYYMLDLMVDTVFINDDFYFQNFDFQARTYADNIGTIVSWASIDSSYWSRIAGDGYIYSPTKFDYDLHASQFYSKEVGLWHIDKDAHVRIDTTHIELDNLLAINHGQTIKLDGVLSEDPKEKFNFEISNFDLQNLTHLMGEEFIELDGRLLLDGFISNIFDKPYMDAYSMVDGLTMNGYYAGNLEASTNWNPILKRMEITGDLIRKDMESDFSISKGYYYLDRTRLGRGGDVLDFQFDFKETDLTFVNALLPEGISDLSGNVDGTVYMKGAPESPKINGSIFMNQTALDIDMMNVRYTVDGQVLFEPDMVLLNGLPIKDKFGSKGFLVGSFFHQNFEDYSYDFNATFNKPFLVMNTEYYHNPLYYGDAYITGDVTLSYDKINQLEINVQAKSEKGTNITLPLYGSEEVVMQDFITFVDSETTEEEDYQVDLEGIHLNLGLDITEDAEIQLVFDEVVGDMMKGKGNGHIDMYIDPYYDFYMFGNYEITEGSYLFTLKEFINKKFEVKRGSDISWYGDPYNADINIKAFYPLRASLYDIMPLNDKEKYKQKSEVECIMHLTENLFNPNIDFDIELPKSDENAKTVLRNLVSSDQEMNKQVFSLLILNKFLPRADGIETSDLGFGKATTSEVLSNQLSNMISNFSDDFDIGFNYSPGDNISNDEVAVAMSTQLFNDRMSISTNLGVSQGSEANHNPSSFIGDVDVEYKLNPPEGNLRIHGFNESNEYDITKIDQARNTQGIGAFYHEDFDSFSELICNMFNLFRRSKKDKDCSVEAAPKHIEKPEEDQ